MIMGRSSQAELLIKEQIVGLPYAGMIFVFLYMVVVVFTGSSLIVGTFMEVYAQSTEVMTRIRERAKAKTKMVADDEELRQLKRMCLDFSVGELRLFAEMARMEAASGAKFRMAAATSQTSQQWKTRTQRVMAKAFTVRNVDDSRSANVRKAIRFVYSELISNFLDVVYGKIAKKQMREVRLYRRQVRLGIIDPEAEAEEKAPVTNAGGITRLTPTAKATAAPAPDSSASRDARQKTQQSENPSENPRACLLTKSEITMPRSKQRDHPARRPSVKRSSKRLVQSAASAESSTRDTLMPLEEASTFTPAAACASLDDDATTPPAAKRTFASLLSGRLASKNRPQGRDSADSDGGSDLGEETMMVMRKVTQAAVDSNP